MNSTSRFIRLAVVALLCDLLWSFTLNGLPRSRAPMRSGESQLQSPIPSGRIRLHRLHAASPPAPQSSSSSPPSSATTQVLYQKVVRPSSDLPDVLFLGYLVEYLEIHFQLPPNLPMVYESLPGNEETRCILAWDSPLSPSQEATRMEVEVVGIYTDKPDEDQPTMNTSKKKQQQSVPNMAMVVVRKQKSSGSSSTVPPMMQNLFQDSEKRILKSLDRGLEDFIAGKIKFDVSHNNDRPKAPKNVKTVEEALKVELVDSIPEREKPKVDAKDVVYEAYATTEQDKEESTKSKVDIKKKNPTADNVAAALESTNVKAQSSIPSAKTKEDESSKKPAPDFAVEAAKRKTAVAKTIPKPLEDYAVAAARRVREKQAQANPAAEDFAVAAARKASSPSRKSAPVQPPPRQQAKAVQEEVRPEIQPDEPPMSIPSDFKIPDYMGNDRAFRTTISRPKDRAKGSQQQSRPTASKSLGAPLPRNSGANSREPSPKTELRNGKQAPTIQSIGGEDSGRTSVDNGGDESPEISSSKPMPSREQIERDIMKAAQDMMSEMAEQGKDMTPEELLQDVLKFGEEKEKEKEAGSGFVSAAFDKAKDLLRHQNEQRKAKVGHELGYKELDSLAGIQLGPLIANDDSEELSAEEELRRMFQAGERIADGRITKTLRKGEELATKGTTEEDIDALIAKDRTISKHARSLDDELIELELAINASPGEELDGPRQNPFFDIMSGPELYNPNVELDAVNYPGAMLGTKNVDLPKELKEAIQQAEFAVEILVDLKRVESVGDKGQEQVKFFAGERELSQEQVMRLETVAREAIEIGLIKDPVKLVDESSRLQMIVDELLNQPKERFREIAENYKDLLLSDNFADLIKARLVKMADRDLDALRRNDESLREPHEREREILGQLVVYTQLLLKEARALGAQLEARQLEVVRSICQVAMDPKHQTEEETANALSDAVRDMRPLLDDSFVAYLKYAVAEEEARLARSGLVDDPEHNQWLFVLKIVQQGVYAEISKSINRYIEHIWYVLRMETPKERTMLLSRLIDAMPTMDVRPFVHVVENIVGSLGDATRGEFDGVVPLGEMTNKLLQLHRDVKDLLPPERIALKSRDADEWAAKQKKRLLEARKLGKHRLKNADGLANRQDEIDAIGRNGEVERFD